MKSNAPGQGGDRVNFDHGVRVHIAAVDGSWRRACMMSEVSQAGAKLTVSEGIDKLDLSEFMLLLTPTGIVSRRCELVRADGEEMYVRFVAVAHKKPSR
jgi:hypothetical protein